MRKIKMLVAASLAFGIAMPDLAAQETVVQAAQTTGTPDERAASMVAMMTLDEKLTLLKGYFGTDFAPSRFEAPEEARYGSAGYVPGIARLGIPPQWQADAGIGVATQGGALLGRAALRAKPTGGPLRGSPWR